MEPGSEAGSRIGAGGQRDAAGTEVTGASVAGGTLAVELVRSATEPVLAVHGISSQRRLWNWLRAARPGLSLIAPDLHDAEAEALFEARRLAYPALERLGPVLTEDVCVPRSKVPAMLEQISAIAARHGVTTATIAHAGDGNLHPLLITPPGDSAARTAAQAAFEEFLDAAIMLGGTITGEHGVGILKRDGMRRELDPGSVALQSAIRSTLDPRGVFNPGKG